MNQTWADVFARIERTRDEIAREVSSPAHSSPSLARPVIAAVACLLIAGCAVGPNFKRPAAPNVSDYTVHPLSTTVASTNVTGGEAQRFAKGSDIPGDWWTLFHSRPLNELIEQSLANNPDLKAAQAALSVARENVLAQRGVYFPNVSADFSASRQKTPGTISPTPSSNALLYSLYTPQYCQRFVCARSFRAGNRLTHDGVE